MVCVLCQRKFDKMKRTFSMQNIPKNLVMFYLFRPQGCFPLITTIYTQRVDLGPYIISQLGNHLNVSNLNIPVQVWSRKAFSCYSRGDPRRDSYTKVGNLKIFAKILEIRRRNLLGLEGGQIAVVHNTPATEADDIRP